MRTLLRPLLTLTTAWLVVPAALLCAAPASDDPPPEGDLAKIQGNWQTKVMEIPVVVQIKGKAVTVIFTNDQGEKIEIKGEVKLDEKATPKACDWINFKRQDGTDADPNLGIYRIEGDTWTVCNGGPNNPRPTEFKEGENGPPTLLVLKRVPE